MITGQTYIILAVGVGVAAILWLFLTARSKTPKKFLVREFFFSTLGAAFLIEAETVTGALLTDRFGGQKEDPATVAIYRRGRLSRQPGNRDPQSMRRREFVYVTRQHDPQPLNLRSLFTGGKLSKPVLKAEVQPIEDFAVDLSIAQASRKPGSRDVLTRRLALIALFSVVMGGLSLAVVAVTASLRA